MSEFGFDIYSHYFSRLPTPHRSSPLLRVKAQHIRYGWRLCGLALYKLSANITYTEHIQPICLPQDDSPIRLNGSKATMVDWSWRHRTTNEQAQQMSVETEYYGEDEAAVVYTYSSSATDTFVSFIMHYHCCGQTRYKEWRCFQFSPGAGVLLPTDPGTHTHGDRETRWSLHAMECYSRGQGYPATSLASYDWNAGEPRHNTVNVSSWMGEDGLDAQWEGMGTRDSTLRKSTLSSTI